MIKRQSIITKLSEHITGYTFQEISHMADEILSTCKHEHCVAATDPDYDYKCVSCGSKLSKDKISYGCCSERLFTPEISLEQLAEFVSENIFGEQMQEDKPVRNLHIYAFCKLLLEKFGKNEALK